MPKKRKIAVDNKLGENAGDHSTNGNSSPAETKKKSRATATPPKKKKPAAPKKSAPKKSAASGTHTPVEPSDEQIRLRAYFLAERRHRLSLPGDSAHDWIEARRQLIEEAKS